MKKHQLFKVMAIASLAFVAVFAVLFGLAAGPAAAEVSAAGEQAPALQGTVVVPPANDGDAVIVPDTGPGDAGVFSSWLIWLILGVIVAALLVAVVSRAAAPPPVVHHHDHDHHDDMIE